MKIATIGLESSGNHWIQDCLSEHPEIELAATTSAPAHGGKDRAYLPVPEDVDFTIVITRDRTCQARSVADRGYNKGNEDRFSQRENMDFILGQIDGRENVLWVSYETAVNWGQPYFDWLFKQLGLETTNIETECVDGNRKYIK